MRPRKSSPPAKARQAGRQRAGGLPSVLSQPVLVAWMDHLVGAISLWVVVCVKVKGQSGKKVSPRQVIQGPPGGPRGKGSCRQGRASLASVKVRVRREQNTKETYAGSSSRSAQRGHLVLRVMQKVLREESWHRRRQRGGGGPCGRAYLGWAVGKGGRGDGGLMTRIMVCPGGGAGHQLPAAHRDVREGQRQQSVPAGPGERRRRPRLALEGRRPAAGATESAKTGTGKGRCARALSLNRHTRNGYRSKAYQQHINDKGVNDHNVCHSVGSVRELKELARWEVEGTRAVTRTYR